jgi:hypothetical protein
MQTLETVSSTDSQTDSHGLSEPYPGGVAVEICPPQAGRTAPTASSVARLTAGVLPAAVPEVAEAVGMEAPRLFGVFYGLRAVFLLYVCAGVIAALGYEMWCLLTR